MAEPVLDPVESTKRLEMHVKRISSVKVAEEPTPDMARSNLVRRRSRGDNQTTNNLMRERAEYGTFICLGLVLDARCHGRCCEAVEACAHSRLSASLAYVMHLRLMLAKLVALTSS